MKLLIILLLIGFGAVQGCEEKGQARREILHSMHDSVEKYFTLWNINYVPKNGGYWESKGDSSGYYGRKMDSFVITFKMISKLHK